MTNSIDSNQTGGALENMNSEKDFDIFLQTQLQRENPYLPDDNFSLRVMASLPIAKKSISWRQRLLALLPLIIISILVLSQNSLLAFAIKSWVLLSILSMDNLFKALMTVSLLALIGVSYWFAKHCRIL